MAKRTTKETKENLEPVKIPDTVKISPSDNPSREIEYSLVNALKMLCKKGIKTGVKYALVKGQPFKFIAKGCILQHESGNKISFVSDNKTGCSTC